MRHVILITGASRGIGRYLAEYYCTGGHRVIGCSRRASEFTHERYHHITADITDDRAVVELVRQARKVFGPIDVLLNNAGIASMNHALLTPTRTVRAIFATNVFGTFAVTREVAKSMARRKHGRIVNFATVATPLKLEGESAYAASKAAIVSLTEILAHELADLGITVNAVGATPVKTDLIRNVPKAKLERLIERQAIKRFGEFEDISNVIDFFISERSGFVTGQTIYLGGVS